ncbi:uncharacterized protein [Halyomorpha halys]|uniref:uncharacterized protein isoform X1 n=1 Tax=Halyomorpha halys TaxID=286706 RepID=UPI0006D4F9C4|nr:uncharacterized protein LOC106686505 isoform X1 [Halyomorpha halys]XP_024216243.1 uncharacterized protein LOC106686505 isoform X1 [Halyomorpha halys]
MSSRELECSLKNLKMSVGESHETQPDESSLTSGVLKDELGPNFIDDADKAYIILINVFRYLSRKELRSAAQVCKVWNLVGSDSIFWKKICLNNCIVHDISMMVQTLKKNGTELLDLRGVSFNKTERGADSKKNGNERLGYQEIINILVLPNKWSSIYQTLNEVTTLTDITIEECPPSAVFLLTKGLPQLKSLSAYKITTEKDFLNILDDDFLDLTPLKNMKDLLTLKLENYVSRTVTFNESSSDTTDKIGLNLKVLAMTRVINLSCIEHILPSTLVSLTLGECHSLSTNFFENVLPELVNLTRLRLEMCRNENLTTILLETISKLPNLSELELINFEISKEFQIVLAKCTNLKSLLIIPIYKRIPQHLHPLINKRILSGVSVLKNSLQVLVWVVTDEMASINNIRRNQSNVRLIGHGDFVPFVVKRSAGCGIDFCSFDKLQAILLPYLKFKIIKSRFSYTWKLSLHNIRM